MTEDNPELLCSLNAAVLRVLESVLLSSQPDMAHTLLRTLAAGTHCHFFLNESCTVAAHCRVRGFESDSSQSASCSAPESCSALMKWPWCASPPSGTLWNMKASLPVARQAQTLNAVVAALSSCLDMDAGTLIPELRQAEGRKTTAASDSEEQAAAAELHEEVMEEEEEEAPPSKKNGKAARTDTDFSDLLPVSGLTVKCYVNPGNSKVSAQFLDQADYVADIIIHAPHCQRINILCKFQSYAGNPYQTHTHTLVPKK